MEEATGMKRAMTQRLVESARSLHAASLELAALKNDRSNKVRLHSTNAARVDPCCAVHVHAWLQPA